MANRDWTIALVAGLALMVGVLAGGSGLLSGAHGASEGQTAGVIALVGEAVSQEAPVVLVDIPDQTVIVYEYDYQNDEIELTAARTYRYDKLLRDFPAEHDGPSVREVEAVVRGRGR